MTESNPTIKPSQYQLTTETLPRGLLRLTREENAQVEALCNWAERPTPDYIIG